MRPPRSRIIELRATAISSSSVTLERSGSTIRSPEATALACAASRSRGRARRRDVRIKRPMASAATVTPAMAMTRLVSANRSSITEVGVDTRTTSPGNGNATYRWAKPELSLSLVSWPTSPRRAARTSGRSPWFSNSASSSCESATTSPSGAIRVTRTPVRFDTSVIHASSSPTPNPAATDSPRSTRCSSRSASQIERTERSTIPIISRTNARATIPPVTRTRLEMLDRPGGSLIDELVPETTHRDDVGRPGGLPLDLLPQPLDVYIEGLGVAEVRRAPNLGDESVSLGQTILSPHQRLEEVELLRGQVHRLAVHPNHMGLDVHLHSTAPQHLVGLGELTGAGEPAELRPDAGDQLPHGERLGHVVVGPELEPGDLVGFGVLRREHDDGGVAERSDLPTNVETGHSRKHEVEQNDVGVVRPRGFETGGAASCRGHHESLGFQGVLDRLGERRFVLDHQHPEGACFKHLGALSRFRRTRRARRSPGMPSSRRGQRPDRPTAPGPGTP